jgi:hypothetical protein
MGLDERSRAADSLASVLAVYDGFCNLKQVRPSQSSPGKKMSPFFFLLYTFRESYCVHSTTVVQSSDLVAGFGFQ